MTIQGWILILGFVAILVGWQRLQLRRSDDAVAVGFLRLGGGVLRLRAC